MTPTFAIAAAAEDAPYSKRKRVMMHKQLTWNLSCVPSRSGACRFQRPKAQAILEVIKERKLAIARRIPKLRRDPTRNGREHILKFAESQNTDQHKTLGVGFRVQRMKLHRFDFVRAQQGRMQGMDRHLRTGFESALIDAMFGQDRFDRLGNACDLPTLERPTGQQIRSSPVQSDLIGRIPSPRSASLRKN